MTADTTTFEIEEFGGEIFLPGEAGYEEGRTLFNAMIDRHPKLIARCTTANDVVAAVKYARKTGIPFSVYGGGHGVIGAAVVDDGLVCDLRGLKGITVDAAAQTVRAEGGVNWGEFDAATQAHGLATTGGRVPSTGLGGLVLGSGSGWLERKFGFACDNLIAAEVVTADGRAVTASETENAELFWGLRGGGGNFGIVTAFHFRLHELPPLVLGGMVVWPAEMAREVAGFYRDFMLAAPDEVGSGLAFITAPPLDFVPEPVRGHPIVAAICCYAGPIEDGEAAFRPLREFGPPGMDMVQPMPYLAVQQLIEPGNPKGMQNYWTADFYSSLPDEALDVFVAHATKPVSPLSQMIFLPGGGAIARVPEDATAFGQRRAEWNVHYLSMWSDPADNDKNIAYTKAISEAMKPWSTGRAYLNFIGEEGTARVEAAFGPEKYARLQALKKVWDPDISSATTRTSCPLDTSSLAAAQGTCAADARSAPPHHESLTAAPGYPAQRSFAPPPADARLRTAPFAPPAPLLRSAPTPGGATRRGRLTRRFS
jgi:FAD/FMN-containing dehydrogenase